MTEKVAIITGGSQGIGAGLVAGYRRQGWAVVATARAIKPSQDPEVLTVDAVALECAADGADDHRFHQELHLNIATGSADGLADADLADALAHVGEHDVHDAHSADDERDHGHEQQDHGERVGGAAGHFHQLGEVAHGVG